MDGAVARYKNLSTKQGAYLDTICDRYVEGMLLFSFTTLTLSTIIFESYIWIFLIFFGSLMTTYSKAAAKEKELTQTELKGGLFSRGERLICLLFALIIYTYNPLVTLYILIITAILSNITALQRIVKALKNS